VSAFDFTSFILVIATLLENCAEENRSYVTLDDLEQRDLAQNDPALFFQLHNPPVTIDEIQYAPQLLNEIKILVDKNKQPGMFWLTGSQKFHLMKGVTETLAGRVAIIDLLGLSQAEIENRADRSLPFLPTQEWIKQAENNAASPKRLMDVYTNIWQGSYPKVIADKNMPHDIFYNSYIQTYIQRDVRDLTRVGNEQTFHHFLRAAAARSGQLLNYANLARDVDIDQKTVKSWLSILETSGIIYLLQPYHSNLTKRLIKTPKLYFLDTGLCAYLTQWSTAKALEAGAMSGAILETYILAEIIKSYWHNGLTPYLYFYRDKDQKEVDLIIEQNGALYPVEFKKTAAPGRNASKHFPVLEKLDNPIGHGAVICLRETGIPLSQQVDAIPISYL
jgi:predicted AAA+ superfamily ATPase